MFPSSLLFSHHMQPEMWQKCLGSIEELLDILFANPNIFIGENIAEDSENLANSEQVSISESGIIPPHPWGILPTR